MESTSDTINMRIMKFIPMIAKSNSEFARKCNIPPSTINSITSNRSYPSYEAIASISKTFPQLNVEWLLHGIGDMFKEKTESLSEIVEFLKRENNLLIDNNRALLSNNERLWNMVDTIGKKAEANKWTRVVKLDLPAYQEQA